MFSVSKILLYTGVVGLVNVYAMLHEHALLGATFVV